MKNLTPALKISIIYFLISFIWILGSDKMIFMFINDMESLNFLQTIKGWFFITATSFLMYVLINKYFQKEKNLTLEIENIFNYTNIPIVLFNSDGKALRLNHIWTELTGYELSEINTLEKWVEKAYGDKALENKKLFESFYELDRKVELGEFEVKTKDNRVLIWHFSMAPYGIVDGKRAFICAALDITELRKKERLLIQQSKMAMMGEMIGNIAHQWKQPLSLISTSNGLLKLNKEYSNFSEEDVDKAISDIDVSVQNLATTIDDFRNFFDPNKCVINFSIKELFDKTFKLIKSQLINNNIEIIKNIKEVHIRSLENELLQVLINIIKNAKEELVKLDVNSRRLLFIESYSQDDNLIIKIKDNANGIPEEIIHKIFDSYFTTKKSEGGSGIGLYMSKQIIEENMYGSIKALNESYIYEEKSYKGAVFIIIIPLIYLKS